MSEFWFLVALLIFFSILWSVARRFETRERDTAILLSVLYAVEAMARRINKIYDWCVSRLHKENS